jgi:hypothetical protein
MAVLPPDTKNNEETFMTIVRIDAEARWSDVVIHNQTLYYTGVPANLDADASSRRPTPWRRLTRCWKNRAATNPAFWMRPFSCQ